jgi:hypothetical protein
MNTLRIEDHLWFEHLQLQAHRAQSVVLQKLRVIKGSSIRGRHRLRRLRDMTDMIAVGLRITERPVFGAHETILVLPSQSYAICVY